MYSDMVAFVFVEFSPNLLRGSACAYVPTHTNERRGYAVTVLFVYLIFNLLMTLVYKCFADFFFLDNNDCFTESK